MPGSSSTPARCWVPKCFWLRPLRRCWHPALFECWEPLLWPHFVTVRLKNHNFQLIGNLIPAGMVVFYASHIHPVIYLTVPASFLLGILLGLLSSAHTTFLMILTHRISGLFHEDDDDGRYARRTCIIRRVARAFQVRFYPFTLLYCDFWHS